MENALLVQSDVAAMRGIKSSTIVSHLSDCIRTGFPVDIERLDITDDVEKLIVDVIRKPPINSGIFTVCFDNDHNAINLILLLVFCCCKTAGLWLLSVN